MMSALTNGASNSGAMRFAYKVDLPAPFGPASVSKIGLFNSAAVAVDYTSGLIDTDGLSTVSKLFEECLLVRTRLCHLCEETFLPDSSLLGGQHRNVQFAGQNP